MNPFNMELIKNLEKRKIEKYSPLKIIMEYSPPENPENTHGIFTPENTHVHKYSQEILQHPFR